MPRSEGIRWSIDVNKTNKATGILRSNNMYGGILWNCRYLHLDIEIGSQIHSSSDFMHVPFRSDTRVPRQTVIGSRVSSCFSCSAADAYSDAVAGPSFSFAMRPSVREWFASLLRRVFSISLRNPSNDG